MNFSMDDNLLKDFLTESAELIEKLDADLVKLEQCGSQDGSRELLDSVFRALHTVKGAAGFLNLGRLTVFAHAAEDALNKLRRGEVVLSAAVMDVLLRSVDVLRSMIDELANGRPLSECPADVLQRLHEVAGGKLAAESASAVAGSTAGAGPAVSAPAPADGLAALPVRPLVLPDQKRDLLSLMVTDLRDTAKQMSSSLGEIANPTAHTDAAAHLAEIGTSLTKTAEFFDLASLGEMAQAICRVAAAIPDLPDAVVEQALARLKAARLIIDRQADVMDQSKTIDWPLESFLQRLTQLSNGKTLEEAHRASPSADEMQVLALDGVIAATSLPAVDPEAGADRRSGGDRRTGVDRRLDSAETRAEQTIRVEVNRLEALLNLVGQMVLAKNRVLGLSRRLRERSLGLEITEEATGTASELDRLTSELQVAVMRTRMQPLAKLFDRYPRVIRDIARSTGKQIELEITGQQTEVDKSVMELLADPLVHILRNSADHGIEPPEVSQRSGKSAAGVIHLGAEHQGGHVRVVITDDGKGIDRKAISAKAIERGLISAEQLAQMADRDVLGLIFAPGLSTAEKVTDLSGRGVGMDVVRTNVAKMNGSILVSSPAGKGTTIEILIPLTVAIMPAMVVGVGRELYCVPLQNIVEIVRPQPGNVHRVNGQSVMRLRDTVLPLVDVHASLGLGDQSDRRFALVVDAGGLRVGLWIDRLIGQQEIVIKPLDDQHTRGGPFSGATIQENGQASLILDVLRLVRQAPQQKRAA